MRRPAQARNQPQGPLGTLWVQLRPYLRGPIAVLSLPVSVALSVLSSALAFLARLLRIRPSFGTFSLRRGGPALAADPRSCAERWVRGLEEQAGVRGLPCFELCGYEEALRKAKDELRPMLAILVSEEHDDTPEFKRAVLGDPELLQCLEQNRFVVWGGDVRDRDAYVSAWLPSASRRPSAHYAQLLKRSTRRRIPSLPVSPFSPSG
jgi:FAS-associated factor 2